jgi:aminoglycoside phosphotransferase (APT) family kinase protein
VAADPSGEAVGDPALLMTLLAGEPDLDPLDPDSWLVQAARTLATIHEADIGGRPYESWLQGGPEGVMGRSRNRGLWMEAFHVMERPPPSGSAQGFMHRDYNPLNLLWQRGRLSGVVDWVEACSGPQDVDVGHMAANLAALYSADLADRFRLAYEAEAGRPVDPWWELHARLSFLPVTDEDVRALDRQVAGRLELDRTGLMDRLDDHLQAILGRLEASL